MEKYDLKFKKKYGQNFLKDVNIVKRIVDVVKDREKSLVIEVGPGGGIMTRELATSFDNVLCYEIDDSLKDELNSRIGEFDNVDVIYNDFLACDIDDDIKKYDYKKLYFISNVPYYITSPIILKLIDSGVYFNKIVMMVQKEVGDRFSSNYGTKEYGAISVILQYYFDIKKEFVVSRGNFIPVPNVDSVIISFTPKNRTNKCIDDTKLRSLVNNSFQFKRKTIKNNLFNYDLDIVKGVLENHGYDLNSSAEEIDVDTFIDLSNSL